MPFCDVSRYQKEEEISATDTGGIKIFYRRYGRGSTKVLLIIGLAGTHDGWGPQVKGLTGVEQRANEEEEVVVGVDGGFLMSDGEGRIGGVEVCCFDNRGMGRSSVPTRKSDYTTMKMAKDALALLDHLGWEKAHVFGHSMGAMVACKLAAVAPDRLCSLALLNVTGGGFQCFPKIDYQMISLAFRFLRAKTPEQRAIVDLETHYTKEYLAERLESSTRGEILYQEYVKAISSTGMQSNNGFEGQFNACWTHSMSAKELEVIRSASFHVLVLHGRYDIIAQVCHARNIARELRPSARMVELHGAHLVSHERFEEVNCHLLELIEASESNLSMLEWSSLPQNSTGGLSLSVSISSHESELKGTICSTAIYDFLAKIQLLFLYFFGLLVLSFKYAKNAYRLLKPSRVSASI